jgi:hypothetical protein
VASTILSGFRRLLVRRFRRPIQSAATLFVVRRSLPLPGLAYFQNLAHDILEVHAAQCGSRGVQSLSDQDLPAEIDCSIDR